jgi:hypothetical protein
MKTRHNVKKKGRYPKQNFHRAKMKNKVYHRGQSQIL